MGIEVMPSNSHISISQLNIKNPCLLTTAICLTVGYGSRDDPIGSGGLAHMLEHLLMSTPIDSGLSFSEQIERMGGQADAETGLEQMRFYARVHPEDGDKVARLLCRAVLNPAWVNADLDRERKVVIQELRAAQADPSDAVQDAILATIFPGHPLGRPVSGSEAEVERLSLEEIDHYFTSVVTARAMKMICVGPVGLTSGLEDTKCVPTATPRVDLGRIRWKEPAWPEESFVWVCMGARSPAMGQPQTAAYRILATLLDSSSPSLLYRQLRNKSGLAYNFHAWDRGYTEAGAWRLLIGTESVNAPYVVRIVRNLLEELADSGPNLEDLGAAIRQAEMRLVFDAEDPLEHAKLIGDRVLAEGSPWILSQEIALLRAVSRDDVANAAKLVLDGLVIAISPESST
jgi:predicted Zn-dependent peptidase